MKNEIEKIYTKYNFMDKETFDKYINIAYERSSKNKEPIKKIIYNLLNKEIYISLNKCDMKYINNYIDLNDEIKDNIVLFKKICNFFTDFSFTPNIDFAIKLITENKKMATILKKIYSDKKGNVDNLFNGYIPKIFITAYMFSNNLNDKKEVDGIKKLGYDEEYEIIKQIKNGNKEVRDKFLQDNMGLVISIVNKFSTFNVEFDDLFQEGCLGLLKAIDKFDVEMGYKFSTYAIWWIRHYVSRYIQKTGRTIRIPVSKQEQLIRYKKKTQELEQKLNKNLTTDDISKHLNISKNKVLEYELLLNEIVSLNQYVSPNEEYELINVIPDEKTDIENLHLEDSMILDVRRVFENSNLNEREKDILINRFGLYGNDEQVLKDLGDKYHVSKERIRKIQEDSLKKLRDDKKIIELSIYMNNPEKALESLKTLKKKKYKQSRKK